MAQNAELITRSTSAIREVGLDFSNITLQGAIYLEAPRALDPVLVKFADGTYAILVRNVEYGNYLPHGRAYAQVQKHNIAVCNYDYYFTMTEIGKNCKVAADDALALRENYSVAEVTVHDDMPLARYLRFRDQFPITIQEGPREQKDYCIYRVDRSYVTDAFCRLDEKDVEVALNALKTRSHVTESELADLEKYMRADRIDPFTILNGMLPGVNCVFADTQLTVHTFTGLPWHEIEPEKDFALYTKDATYLISEREWSKPFLTLEKIGKGLPGCVQAVSPCKNIGVEEKSLLVGIALEFGLENLTDVSDDLTLWRNRFSYQALPYFIINSIANVDSMEKALDITREALATGRKMTEKDVQAVFEKLLADTPKLFGFEHLEIERYFTVLHAGTRCPYPALASDYVIHNEMTTLKLDSGVTLYRNGMRMSTSDLARMITLPEEVSWLCSVLANSMREDVIRDIKVGMTGEEVYWLGLARLRVFEDEMKARGVLAPEFSLMRDYNRNIGHTMDKEESTAIVAKKGDNRKFEALMVGCIEYQWPYKTMAIAVEDMFFITPDRTINITY